MSTFVWNITQKYAVLLWVAMFQKQFQVLTLRWKLMFVIYFCIINCECDEHTLQLTCLRFWEHSKVHLHLFKWFALTSFRHLFEWFEQIGRSDHYVQSVETSNLSCHVMSNTSANWNAVSHQIWWGCHTSVDSGDLSKAPPKQSAWVPPNLSWVTLDRTLSYREYLTKDCRQAEEPKQLVDEASRFYLGRQRQHSAVICSGTTRSAHTSQVDVQLNSTMHLISCTLCSTPLPWLSVLSNIEPPVLRRKAATDKLVEKIVKHDSWPIQPGILNPPLLRLTSRKPLWLDLQPVDIKGRWRHNWKSAQVVNSHLVCDSTIWQPGFDLPRQQCSAEPFSHRTGTLRCLQKEMATYRHWSVSLWREADDVPHCRILFPDKTEWRLISATLCGWRRCFVADQLWFMTRIREEDVMSVPM